MSVLGGMPWLPRHRPCLQQLDGLRCGPKSLDFGVRLVGCTVLWYFYQDVCSNHSSKHAFSSPALLALLAQCSAATEAGGVVVENGNLDLSGNSHSSDRVARVLLGVADPESVQELNRPGTD